MKKSQHISKFSFFDFRQILFRIKSKNLKFSEPASPLGRSEKMKNHQKVLWIIICMLAFFSKLPAQTQLSFSQIVAASNETENEQLQVSWVIGNVVLAQLAVAPDEEVNTSVESTSLVEEIHFVLQGNPTHDLVILSSSKSGLFIGQLCNAQGSFVKTFRFDGNSKTELSLGDLPAQVYFLSVFEASEKRMLKSFKVVKL